MPNEIIRPEEAAKRLVGVAKQLVEEMQAAGATDRQITYAITVLFGDMTSPAPVDLSFRQPASRPSGQS